MKLPKDFKIAKTSSAPIVHVDDDLILTKIVKRYHKKSKINNPYISFSNGDDFLSYLDRVRKEKGEYPLLVLLDINMPGKDGFEVLKTLRENEDFKEIPLCFILSSSTYDEDIQKSLQLGANSYLVKPDNAKEYQEFFDDISKNSN